MRGHTILDAPAANNYLSGFVIIGKLIPAGTGMERYRNIEVEKLKSDDELKEATFSPDGK